MQQEEGLPPLLANAVPDWDFTLADRVGTGGSSVVWRARSKAGTEVALKVARDEQYLPVLQREALRLVLAHGHQLPRVHGSGRSLRGAIPDQPAGAAYLALSWRAGQALQVSELLDEERAEVAWLVARDVGAALAELHRSDLAHGDVKPSNVLVERDEQGRARRAHLIDFGLSDGARTKVPRGASLRYLSPDTFEGDVAQANGTAATRDLWAFGLLLAEIGCREVATAPEPSAAITSVALPEGLRAVVLALTSSNAGLRPSASWVERRARRELGRREEVGPGPEEDPQVVLRREASITRSYLAQFAAELEHIVWGASFSTRVSGEPGNWLQRAAESLSGLGVRTADTSRREQVFEQLSPIARLRWLVSVIGPKAARFRLPAEISDEDLASSLMAVAQRQELETVSELDLFGRVRVTPIRGRGLLDPVAMAVALSAGGAAPILIDEVEAALEREPTPLSASQQSLALIAAHALKLAGEYGRALLLLARLPAKRARAEVAELQRRVGDIDAALATLGAERTSAGPLKGSRARATLSRVLLSRGDAPGARQALADPPESVAELEAAILVVLQETDLERADVLLQVGRGLARTPEEHARAHALSGNVLHAGGRYTAALESFRRAAEYAEQVGALLEEATYGTGLAASASSAGQLEVALMASERAELLFEHLRLPGQAARAALARASLYATAGAVPEARAAAGDSMTRARAAGDRVCEAYAHLALAHVADRVESCSEHVQRARHLMGVTLSDVDRLRLASYEIKADLPVDEGEFDRLAGLEVVAPDVRLAWWQARAQAEMRRPEPRRADHVLGELSRLASSHSSPASLGPAAAAGLSLAARVQDGQAVVRFAETAHRCAQQLIGAAPASLRPSLQALAWVKATAQQPRELVRPEQLGGLKSLVHILAARDRLQPLLDQVIDALLMWTGVERGLLLLKSPGNKLVPRAARNLAKEDMRGEQLKLSMTLAERALASGEPVVAVDAAGELPEVHRSVHALKLRSVLAVPLVARGEALGVVYLDDRMRRGAFGPDELAWVRVVAALASVAIADARDQLLLRRAVRRARRAEARINDALALREEELKVAQRDLQQVHERRGTRFGYSHIIGESRPIQELLKLVDKVSQSEVPVLIIGESGSGKELVAKAIHNHGSRQARPFVSENCAAIPEGLLESVLFGHVRGAFTGAHRNKPGLLELADKSTLFLDEIAEMSLPMQAKLLRVLQDGEVRPVGADRTRSVDVRIVAATNRDLEERVATGRFREDLFYRLNVIRLSVPALRERRDDIPVLLNHFFTLHGGGQIPKLSRTARQLLVGYAWPGNVRQLENEARRLLVLADSVVLPEHLSEALRNAEPAQDEADRSFNLRCRVEVLERELLLAALENTSGNQTRAAEMLGVSRYGLQKMLKRLGIDAGAMRSS